MSNFRFFSLYTPKLYWTCQSNFQYYFLCTWVHAWQNYVQSVRLLEWPKFFYQYTAPWWCWSSSTYVAWPSHKLGAKGGGISIRDFLETEMRLHPCVYLFIYAFKNQDVWRILCITSLWISRHILPFYLFMWLPSRWLAVKHTIMGTQLYYFLCAYFISEVLVQWWFEYYTLDSTFKVW